MLFAFSHISLLSSKKPLSLARGGLDLFVEVSGAIDERLFAIEKADSDYLSKAALRPIKWLKHMGAKLL